MTVAATPGTAAPNSPRRASPRWCQTPRKLTTEEALNGGFEEGETQPLDWNFREVDVGDFEIASSIRTSKLPSGKHETRDLEMILANAAKGNPLRTLIAEAALSMGGAHAR
ncbi:hypothetical protein MBM_08290 [Drepanopeziza brunnea f. sp. 'multigermtubi' MB_m1]|uniref:Uncharacterized protein n=1 Tax=Marssonina brunnea f. sp. multigermtubi (strain MB_m1) TaxID=1072389 RepID=K1WMM2_MARBU|nr:uncharacterized protein MBM_08290 [Drepanopeziza brunnea f. sp. 'multigermtubi' MB_m1]EKD13572.1 hypothetical protein MBM_08290 [Drepanopeziza brunnea f. sp. 'multigermtubi' MB_m1]